MDEPNKTRPAAPSPSVEDELRKLVNAANGPIVGRTGTFGGVGFAQVPTMPVGARDIHTRLSGLRERLCMVAGETSDQADRLLGASGAHSMKLLTGESVPAASRGLFADFATALDEIDRIVDNIAADQARVRTAID